MEVKLNLPQTKGENFEVLESSIELTKTKYAESRLIECRVVSPSSYGELEYVINEGYRECKRNLSSIMFSKLKAEKEYDELKADALIDDYPAFLEEKKLKDSVQIRDAFLAKNPKISLTKDKLNQLLAIESLLDGKVRVFENVSRFMRKEMDLMIRSGASLNKTY